LTSSGEITQDRGVEQAPFYVAEQNPSRKYNGGRKHKAPLT